MGPRRASGGHGRQDVGSQGGVCLGLRSLLLSADRTSAPRSRRTGHFRDLLPPGQREKLLPHLGPGICREGSPRAWVTVAAGTPGPVSPGSAPRWDLARSVATFCDGVLSASLDAGHCHVSP